MTGVLSHSRYFVVVTKPPYEVTETGWGEFEIIIKIYFHDPNERPVSDHLYNDLTLFLMSTWVTGRDAERV